MKLKKIISSILCFFIISSCLVFCGCGSEEGDEGDNENNVEVVTLTLKNIETYLAIGYTVEKTEYRTTQYSKYVNHEYTANTYSKDEKYRFKNLKVKIGAGNGSATNDVDSSGKGSFFFINNGPISSYTTPHTPKFLQVVSGTVEYEI